MLFDFEREKMDLEDIDFSEISQNELKEMAALVLAYIENPEKGIGKDLFDAIITIVPQTCIEAIVVDNIDGPSKILVTWRDDEHYHGWHFPGGYIRFGDNYEQTVKKVINRELQAGVKKLKFTGVLISNVDSRGHTLGAVFLVELDVNSTKGEWFNHVPKNLLAHHKELLKRAIGWE